MRTGMSRTLFRQAQRIIPGGVNSPVRAFGSVGGTPLFIKRAKGSRVYDADGNSFTDYVLSWGPMILGHAPVPVVNAVIRACRQGTSFGAPTELETQLASLLCKAMPSLHNVRLVNSGTEAVMSAIRVARAFTGRNLVLKFEGCYHGHADYLLAKAGSGMATLGIPSTPGVPVGFTRQTLTAPYNDLRTAKRLVQRTARDLACVIVEPVAGNMGVVPPREEFLPGLREVTREHDVLLIFDEVITGFRVHYGGAQTLYGVTPDLTCLGKIIGGGLPVGAYGGRREIMQLIAPAGPVYQAGTLAGNPLAVTAGIETLKQLQRPRTYESLESRAAMLEEGIGQEAKKAGVAVSQTRVGSLLGTFFTKDPVVDYKSAARAHTRAYARFFHEMLTRSVYFAPSQFEAAFLSTAHTVSDITRTIRSAGEAFRRL